MKLFFLAAVASLASAFVIPDQQILESLIAEDLEIQGEYQHVVPEPNTLLTATFAENFYQRASEQQCADDKKAQFRHIVDSIPNHDEEGLHKFWLWKNIPRTVVNILSPTYFQTSKVRIVDDDEFDFDGPGGPGRRPPRHRKPAKPVKPTKTIYELISGSHDTKVFAHIIDQFDHIKEHLNSNESNLTVYVPPDRAFKSLKKLKDHPKPPKEYVAHWLGYHISPGVHSSHSFSSSIQTVPTFLKQENNGTNHQRIRVQRGPFGYIGLNFFSKVIKTDIPATNGIIHVIDHFLVPPFSALDTIDILPGQLSTLNLGLTKTGLVKGFDAGVPKTGATIFAPGNHAFEKLGPKINAFLFSRFGKKYLKALLKYHLIANHTLFTDAYYPPESGKELTTSDQYHVDLPTVLSGHHLSVDIYNWHGIIATHVNGASRVVVPNIPVKEGVIHLVDSVLIPPRKPKEKESEADSESTDGEGILTSLEEFMERLKPYIES